MPNALAHETSPYLLQHQNNPVQWHPWGPQALARSRAENKPIFLSIGYSACHWCHVMEHESFENEQIAAQLNEHFVCIKVDREERPDLDQIYMNAVQLMTGRGGWPMSVFLTPDLQPFFGGTYWPPEDKMGMPGFPRILAAVSDAWTNRREMALEQAQELTRQLQAVGQDGDGGEKAALGADILRQASSQLQRVFDWDQGGFGGAPKFPHSMDVELLLRLWQRQPRQELLDMARITLDRMAAGGIYDQLAGGFHRYSVDERWLVPHFEKMLYDNGLLLGVYLDAYLALGEARFAAVARETVEYILTYMTDAQGGFHSTEDADSEGEEGKFYVWTPAEVAQVIGEEAAQRFCYVYDVSEAGNFEHGQSILNLPKTVAQCAAVRGWNAEELAAELAESRRKLLAHRDQRIRPGKDDKILVSWNALMIDALARAGTILPSPAALVAAERAAQFILTTMSRPDGRLLHTYRGGAAKLDGYLDDYTYFINALTTLYEATFDEAWLNHAARLAEIVLARFADPQRGGFFFTADDQEQLIARNKDLHDSSVPSGNAMAATALLRLGKLCGRPDFLAAAEGALRAGLPVMQRSPTASGQMLIALDFYLGPVQELVLIPGADPAEFAAVLADLRRRFLPRAVIASRSPMKTSPRGKQLDALFAGREDPRPTTTLFICQNFTCQAPVVGRDAIAKAL